MDAILISLMQVIDIALGLFVWALIISAILSWLTAFNVINTSNQFVSTVQYFLYRITEPALRPIRRFLPDLGGIDISPIVLILFIFFVRSPRDIKLVVAQLTTRPSHTPGGEMPDQGFEFLASWRQEVVATASVCSRFAHDDAGLLELF